MVFIRKVSLSLFVCLVSGILGQGSNPSRFPRQIVRASEVEVEISGIRWQEFLNLQPSNDLRRTASGDYALTSERTIALVSKDLDEFVRLRARLQLCKELLQSSLDSDVPLRRLSMESKAELKRMTGVKLGADSGDLKLIESGSVSLRANQWVSYACDGLERIEFYNPAQPLVLDSPEARERYFKEREVKKAVALARKQGLKDKISFEVRGGRVDFRRSKDTGYIVCYLSEPPTSFAKKDAELHLVKAVALARETELGSARKSLSTLLKAANGAKQTRIEDYETGVPSDRQVQEHKNFVREKLRFEGFDESVVSKATDTMKFTGTNLGLTLFVPVRQPNGEILELAVFFAI